MKLNTFEDLFMHKLKILYSAETEFAKAQPKLAEAASDEELRAALEGYVKVTQGQLELLGAGPRVWSTGPPVDQNGRLQVRHERGVGLWVDRGR